MPHHGDAIWIRAPGGREACRALSFSPPRRRVDVQCAVARPSLLPPGAAAGVAWLSSTMSMTDLAHRSTGVLAWARALGALAALIAAGAGGWALLTSRVEAAEQTLQAHGNELRQHARSIAALERAQRDLAWNVYVVCALQAQQLGVPADSCRRPSEAR